MTKAFHRTLLSIRTGGLYILLENPDTAKVGQNAKEDSAHQVARLPHFSDIGLIASPHVTLPTGVSSEQMPFDPIAVTGEEELTTVFEVSPETTEPESDSSEPSSSKDIHFPAASLDW